MQAATELSQTAKVEVDSRKAIMGVIAQENVFLHRKLKTEKTLLKVKKKKCRFLHLPGHVAELAPLLGVMTKLNLS